MVRTYEQIENEILEIRKDIVAGIRHTLEEKGYGINDIVPGTYASVKADGDWDHITICDYDYDQFTFYHVDSCSLDILMRAYKTVLRAWPNC